MPSRRVCVNKRINRIVLGLLCLGVVCATQAAEAQWRPPRSSYSGNDRIYPQRPMTGFRYAVRGTGVYVNGRQLPVWLLARLQRAVGYVPRGAYWLRSDGTYGRWGGPALGNLHARSSRPAPPLRRSLLSGRFLTGGGVIGGGAVYSDGSGVTFGGGGPIYNR